MSTALPKAKRRPRFGAAWLIIMAGLVTFGLSIWTRSLLHPGPSALETLIAANEPVEHVHALAAGPDGALLVGTHLGVMAGNGNRWARLPGISGDVKAVVGTGAEFLLAGEGIGIARHNGEKMTTLRQGDVQALAVEPTNWDHIFAYSIKDGLLESSDGGRTWSNLADGGEPILALAAGPNRLLVAGDLKGMIHVSTDGGKSWANQTGPGGTVTALLFDGRRLWGLAGGAVLYSDDTAATWQRLPKEKVKVSDRQLVALALEPTGKARLWAISADGLVVSVPH